MILDPPNLLARRMGTTAHISPLLQKARRFRLNSPDDLELLALARGLRYFGKPDKAQEISAESFSNEELLIALISPSAPYSLNRIRMAGALLAANDISLEKIIHLSRQERCEAIIRHIAHCATMIEPENPFWNKLLKAMPDKQTVPVDVLPHVTRFTAMTGITRDGINQKSQWIRPILVDDIKK